MSSGSPAPGVGLEGRREFVSKAARCRGGGVGRFFVIVVLRVVAGGGRAGVDERASEEGGRCEVVRAEGIGGRRACGTAG